MIRLIAFVTKQLLKYTDSKLNEQSGLGKTVPQKLLTWKKSSHLREISLAMRWDLTLVGWIHSLINNLSHLPGWDDFSHIISCLHALLLKMIKDILACLIFLRSSRSELHGKRLPLRNMLKSKWIHSSNRTLRKMISTTEMFW